MTANAVAIGKQSLKLYGKRPDQLTSKQFSRVSLSTMKPAEAAVAVAKTAVSVTQTTIVRNRVSLTVHDSRQAKCETNDCGQFTMLANDKPACLDCGCCSSGLKSKWWSPTFKCKRGLWDA